MKHLSEKLLPGYEVYLRQSEKSDNTTRQYLREARAFVTWGRGRWLTKGCTTAYKRHLQQRYQRTGTVNTKLAALNSFMGYLGRRDCKVAALRRQRRSFTPAERELSRADYDKLLLTALDLGRARLALILQVLCGTGIRISELLFITVAAARAGIAEVTLKGKTRPVLLIEELCTLLLRYAEAQGIGSGPIFVTRTGRPIDRRSVWQDLKLLALLAGVDPSKVFPHSLRHLFARNFHEQSHDLAALADVLGHSSIETTRIYTRESFQRCAERIAPAARRALAS